MLFLTPWFSAWHFPCYTLVALLCLNKLCHYWLSGFPHLYIQARRHRVYIYKGPCYMETNCLVKSCSSLWLFFSFSEAWCSIQRAGKYHSETCPSKWIFSCSKLLWAWNPQTFPYSPQCATLCQWVLFKYFRAFYFVFTEGMYLLWVHPFPPSVTCSNTRQVETFLTW